ncbi:MAG TPA: hypothetical protein VGK92_03025 [Gaiellales bacterium]|jgi:hypothetical protein
MFANNEITDRGLLHRLLERAGHEDEMESRAAWADTIDGAIRDAASASVPPRNRVARPVVVLSAASALSAVAGALRDDDVELTPATIAAVRSFMTDGAGSPLYGSDPLAARRAAEELRLRVERAPLATAAAVT